MIKGFQFKTGRCVNCGACSAACSLLNGWEVKPRSIYTYNNQLIPGIPVINLSMACNHCENPACLEGCPSGAYSKDKITGAVILDEARCLGCRYCQWNCPFDAPKFNLSKKLVEKCHLCYNSADGYPACATACPTGALSYESLSDNRQENAPEWIPGQNLKPVMQLAGEITPKPLKIVPADSFVRPEPMFSDRSFRIEWSLVIFSFIMMINVSLVTSSFIGGVFPGLLSFVMLPAAAIISMFHLGQPLRAWRSVSNPLSSPLSREIIFFILYSAAAMLAMFFRSPDLLLTAAIFGLLLLIVIDSVYIKPDRNSLLGAGQTFLSALLFISYLTGFRLPFAFILLVKVALSLRSLSLRDLQSVRFLGMAFYTIAGMGFISGFAVKSIPVTIIISAGLLIERILFYHDFEPVNIQQQINKHIKDLYYEKKRG